jgi:hypothetical protein
MNYFIALLTYFFHVDRHKVKKTTVLPPGAALLAVRLILGVWTSERYPYYTVPAERLLAVGQARTGTCRNDQKGALEELSSQVNHQHR